MFGLQSASLFGETKKLEREIDEFVDIVSEVGLVFKSIVPTYLNHSANGKFEEMVEKVKEMESSLFLRQYLRPAKPTGPSVII